MCTARSRGANSSSTRDSTRTTAGCTPRTAATPSTNMPRPSSRSRTGCTTGMAAALKKLRVSAGRHSLQAGRRSGDLDSSRCITAITGRSSAPRRHVGSPSSCCKTRCRRWHSPTCAPRPRTTPSFRRTQQMRTDTSNNTVYADADGTIAYFHGNFIPKRDPKFDYTHPVDGSNPATEWHGPHGSRGHDHAARIPAPAGSKTPITGPSRRRARQAPNARTIRSTCGSRARTRAAFTPWRCCRISKA